MPLPATSARVEPIVCDDQIEDEVISKIEDWWETYQAEVERQRGWAPRYLEPLAGVIPGVLLERQPEIPAPCVVVMLSATSGDALRDGGGGLSVSWTLGVDCISAGADAPYTGRRVYALTAAIRALVLKQVKTGPLVTSVKLERCEYSPTALDKGRTLGAGNLRFRITVDQSVTTNRGGLSSPSPNPYEPPSGLGEISTVTVTTGVLTDE